jgi:2-dehydro-3-deoxygluconokinase/dehydrogluconokinase
MSGKGFNNRRVLTFGEAMALFVADYPGPLEGVDAFRRRIAGADSNVAIGLARLGFSVEWLSRIGADAMGAFIRRTLQSEGVNCQHLQVDPARQTGMMFKTRALDGSDPAIEYYRRDSAASQLSLADAEPVEFEGLAHLHMTGIPPALSESARELSSGLAKNARNASASVSFDPNLRPAIWTSEALMRSTLNALAAQADWVMPGLEEGRILTGQKTARDIAEYYLQQGVRGVMIKLGAQGSYYRGAVDGTLEECWMPGVSVKSVVDTVGAGDGFAVGVISTLLEGASIDQALHRGNQIGARAIQVIGDMEGLPSRVELADMSIVDRPSS